MGNHASYRCCCHTSRRVLVFSCVCVLSQAALYLSAYICKCLSVCLLACLLSLPMQTYHMLFSRCCLAPTTTESILPRSSKQRTDSAQSLCNCSTQASCATCHDLTACDGWFALCVYTTPPNSTFQCSSAHDAMSCNFETPLTPLPLIHHGPLNPPDP